MLPSSCECPETRCFPRFSTFPPSVSSSGSHISFFLVEKSHPVAFACSQASSLALSTRLPTSQLVVFRSTQLVHLTLSCCSATSCITGHGRHHFAGPTTTLPVARTPPSVCASTRRQHRDADERAGRQLAGRTRRVRAVAHAEARALSYALSPGILRFKRSIRLTTFETVLGCSFNVFDSSHSPSRRRTSSQEGQDGEVDARGRTRFPRGPEERRRSGLGSPGRKAGGEGISKA